MIRKLVLFVVLFTVSFTYTVIAQGMGVLKKGISINYPEKIQKLVLDPLPVGTYSVGIGGYFPTIDSAFNKLSIDGIAGEVILELIDNQYTAPTNDNGFFLNGPIPGAGPNSRVTIKPADNKNVTIQGNGGSTVRFINTSYVTIDGVGLTGPATLTIHTLSNIAFQENDGIDFLDNSDHNVMQNIIFINEDITRASGSGFWVPYVSTNSAPDSNIIQNNFVKQSGIGIGAMGLSVYAVGNIIRGNKIGSETDSLNFLGIEVEVSKNTIVENNIVQNLKITSDVYYISSVGINSWGGIDNIIRNNTIYNIKADSRSGSTGIMLSGESGYDGSNNLVYNNMVYDIQSTSAQTDSRVTGIQMLYQNNPKIYYNSVYLSGVGANQQGSAALFIADNSTNVDVKNNIFVNTRDESPYCASSICDFSASNLTSDYNDLYYEPGQNNCLVKTADNDYQTLADWQATGQDLNSITELPDFTAPYLHINASRPTNLESGATPIAEIYLDFDGEFRNFSTPDIGADEFEGTLNTVWTMQQLPESDLMLHVKAVNLSVAWALGLHGKVFRTINGGTTWTSVGAGINIGSGNTDCIDAISSTTAFVGGINYDPYIAPPPPDDTTFIWRTTDGGVTWQKVFWQLHGFIDQVKMISTTEGIGLGDPVGGKWTILRTSDSGTTWSRITTEPLQINNELGLFRSLCTYGTKYIWFGTWIGDNSSAAIYHSTDAGITWNRLGIPSFPYSVYSVWFSDSLNGVCSDTSLARTTDGGATWTRISGLPGGHWLSSYYFNGASVAGGKDFWAVIDNTIYQSTDMGASWNSRYTTADDSLTFASIATVGDSTAGWFTSLGPHIYSCRLLNNPTEVRETLGGKIPGDFRLLQNYPNPFNPSTKIRWQSPVGSHVTLKVYDILGREVAKVVNEYKTAGRYEVVFNALYFPSGVYFYQLKIGNFIQTKKMILLK